jgi:hypothetical protein
MAQGNNESSKRLRSDAITSNKKTLSHIGSGSLGFASVLIVVIGSGATEILKLALPALIVQPPGL